MSVPHPASRLFLLTLVAPLACDPDPDPVDTGVAATGTATAAMDTSGGPADTANDDEDSTGGSNPDDDGDDTSADDDAADDMADSEGGTTGEGPYCGEPPAVLGDISQLCVDFEALYADCFFDGSAPRECEGYYAGYCQALLEQYEMDDGAACRAAVEDEFACINGLTCRELESEEVDPCADETGAVEAACPSAR